MKLKKILAGVAAATMAVSAIPAVSASAVTAGATSIDFEDGDCSFVYMNMDSGASDATLTVEDYNGSKQLKVDVADKTAVPKVWFDLYKMMDKENVAKIRLIEFDVTLVPKSEEGIVGWAGGAVGSAGSYGTQVKPGWGQTTWDGGAYNPGETWTGRLSRKFIIGTEAYTEESESPFFGIMRWAASDDADEYYIYIDNITFSDKATGGGNVIPVGITPAAEETEPEAEGEGDATEATETEAAPAETEAADVAEPEDIDDVDVDDDEDVAVDDVDDAAPVVEETTVAVTEAAPAETTAAPAAATTAPATGNVAVASIAAVMAVAGAAALVSKKRK